MLKNICTLLVLISMGLSQSDSLKVDQISVPSDTVKIQEVVQENVDLRTFFNAISNQYKTNIYVDQDIQITDSYRLYSITLTELVNFIANRHNLLLRYKNGVYRFSKRPEPKPVEQPKPKPKELDITFIKGKLSANLKDDDMRKVVDKISTLTKSSVLIDPNLNGKISGHLSNISLSKGLYELFKINGFRVKYESGIYKVFKEYKTYQKTLQKTENKQNGFFVEYTDSLITLDIPNAKVGEVVSVLVNEADLDVVFYDDLTTPVSMKLRLQSLDEAFVKLLRNSEFTFKHEDNIYYFGKRSRKDLVTQEVIKLKYLRAGTGGSSGFRDNSNLTNGYSSGLNNSFANSSQTIVPNNQNSKNNNPNRLNSGQANNRTNRSSRPNVNTSVNRSSSNGGSGFTSEALFSELAKREIDAVPLIEQNAVLITGTKIDIEDGRRIISMLDRPIPQILIKTLVIDIKDGKGLNQDIKAWRGKKSDGVDSTALSTSYLPFQMLFNASDLNYWADKTSDLIGHSIGRLPLDFYAFVKAQETKQNLKIRSTPQVSTLNGNEAYISVGETRFFKINTSYVRDNTTNGGQGTTGININEQWKSLEINNTLQVKPWVNSDGDVTLEIKPKLQSPRDSPDPNIPPSIDQRELESTVRLKNGETIILGGLISEEESEIVTDSFPLLSWIPLIGDIFVSKNKVKSKSELMIYVTPHVYMDEDVKPYIPKSDF